MAGIDKNTLEHIPGENILKESRDDLQTDFILRQEVHTLIIPLGEPGAI